MLSRNALVAAVVVAAVTAQVAVFSLFSRQRRGAQPGPDRGRRRLDRAGPAVRRRRRLLRRPAASTSRRRPTTSPAGGRSRSSSSAILAGRVRGDARRNPLAGLATVAVCSFVGTSLFALSGLILDDHALPVGQMVEVIGISVLWDVVMAPLLLPVLLLVFERTRAPELAY